ncbi:MAG: phosphoribosylamine--glycine ligase [Nannocystaceae bacterium]
MMTEKHMDVAQRILIVGNGAREHALAWRCAHEGHEVLVAPGSDGIRLHARSAPVAVADHDGLTSLAKREAMDLVIVGPEGPLVNGLADRLRSAGVTTFGPSARAAELEGSKAAAKAFMCRHGIPTAAHRTVASLEEGLAVLRKFENPPVVKASGLAAGKGVRVCDTFEQAEAAMRACMGEGRFGAAGETVVLEERLLGEEASFFVITDGERAVTFVPAQDHKPLLDGDRGPNTGGMGAYVPAPVFTDAVEARVQKTIVEPTLSGLRAEGRPFCGVLFVGLMIDPAGVPTVVEYNVRFGDPETQALLFGLNTDLVPHLLAAARGGLEAGRLPAQPTAAVVVASAGYPETSTNGASVQGLDTVAELPDVGVFHAGTRRVGTGWVTNGGRVLTLCARGPRIDVALDRAYAALRRVHVHGGQWRADVGRKALLRLGIHSARSGVGAGHIR